jgi:hypothetical protein
VTTPTARRRGRDTGLCLLLCALLTLAAARHVQALESVAPLSFGIETPDVLLLSVLTALLAGASALTARAHRRGLAARAVAAVGGGIVLLVAVLVAFGDPEVTYETNGGLGLGGAYSSQLYLDFSPVLPWLVGVVAIAALGLLPVAAVGAAVGAGGRARLTRRRRTAALLACGAAALVMVAALEREVALLGVVQGEAQQLTSADALVWVAGLWGLVAAGWSARALGVASDSVQRLALVVPAALLLGSVLLVLGQPGRHACCFAYAPPQQVSPEAALEPAPQEGLPAREEAYVPPPVGPDLLLLAGCLAVGAALPIGLRRVVRATAGTRSGPRGD